MGARRIPAGLALSLMLLLSGPAIAQSTLERSPGLDGAWIGFPWDLEVELGSLFARAPDEPGLVAEPAFALGLGLPAGTAALLRYTPQPAEAGGRDRLDVALRRLFLNDDAGAPLDLALEAGGELLHDRQLTAELSAARWLGGLRLMAAARGFVAGGEGRVAAGAGVVWHPRPGRMPIALAADAASFADRTAGERIAWRAGAQIGVSFTPHTLSVYATNAGLSTSGRYAGTDDVRVGIQVTAHVPLGRFLGRHVPREEARDAVREAAAAERAQPVVIIPIRAYRYAPARIVIDPGTAVEWVNEDAVVHTASADDGSWNSGGLETGERWRAVFDRPGIYTYHCGPHPFMRGAVVVRDGR